jgi:hypothetical protein
MNVKSVSDRSPAAGTIAAYEFADGRHTRWQLCGQTTLFFRSLKRMRVASLKDRMHAVTVGVNYHFFDR